MGPITAPAIQILLPGPSGSTKGLVEGIVAEVALGAEFVLRAEVVLVEEVGNALLKELTTAVGVTVSSVI